jgi:hypothetical protein
MFNKVLKILIVGAPECRWVTLKTDFRHASFRLNKFYSIILYDMILYKLSYCFYSLVLFSVQRSLSLEVPFWDWLDTL